MTDFWAVYGGPMTHVFGQTFAGFCVTVAFIVHSPKWIKPVHRSMDGEDCGGFRGLESVLRVG